MNEETKPDRMKDYAIFIVLGISFFLLAALLEKTGAILFFLVILPLWGVFLILNGRRFLKYEKWYLHPGTIFDIFLYNFFSKNDELMARFEIFIGIFFLAMIIGAIVLAFLG